ncbi:vitamin B12 ABC transporter substrate-binding protein BtuF [Photobacterium carnosum]|uniref:vitamin B12 ABC transporter substrate-binding protein BtuF n=1 Tax=Photobacterium carnosum TaxID=2023717 RepID=UPI00128BC425|nr:vitamin B12 ABC transporter substrate-binding protein BtuF [Photobacterium carnosum]KAE8176952.1 vitamin B12 ABC transporter substrate-binding protein BtuF [Photobacterium carnosum]MCD9514086.1 vitamin B12 ABC transporter substrate-binding protein BtuF [Photobacterium carnosum]MCD9529687.1 vitamin B12 ABC transporter substrate-binding protein BtuF [Photobacterium carnosum]MCD9544920.1 vitamin B12 ABC transporter substrate-binding protein BtuF [Photobacterium carnosum]MCD9549111.1 vitamin B1
MRFLCLLIFVISTITPSVAATLAQQTQRIISLSPHTTEMAYAAGLGNKLIAASAYSDYPPAAEKLERVANYRGLKMERILALKPDLILAWQGGNPSRELARLEQLGIKILYSNPKTLADIPKTLEQLGQYADSPQPAQQAATEFRHQLQQLKIANHNKPKVRYFYQLGSTPLMTVADSGWPSQIFQFCGGENIFANSSVAYPQVNQEQVIVRQPQVIFSAQPIADTQQLWAQWQHQLIAIKQHHIYQLNTNWLNRPTPRTLLAIKQVCGLLNQVRDDH